MTRARASDDIIELHRTLMRARDQAARLASHADDIGDWTFAYWVGQVRQSAWEGIEHLTRARETPRDHEEIAP